MQIEAITTLAAPGGAGRARSFLMAPPRLAPSATRMAIPRATRAARATIRFATFAHAMSSTSPTAPIKRMQRRAHGRHAYARAMAWL